MYVLKGVSKVTLLSGVTQIVTITKIMGFFNGFFFPSLPQSGMPLLLTLLHFIIGFPIPKFEKLNTL